MTARPSHPTDTHSPEHASELSLPRHWQSLNTGAWSANEDRCLREAVLKHGTRWVAVAADVRSRNGEQCAKRWNDKVNPELHHGPWSTAEDKALLALVALHGHNWQLMSKTHFQSRPPLSIKNRHSLLMRRQRRENARQHQQQQRPPASARENEPPPAMDTSPSELHHPCANFDIVHADPGSSSTSHSTGSTNSSLSIQDHVSTVPNAMTLPHDRYPALSHFEPNEALAETAYPSNLSAMFQHSSSGLAIGNQFIDGTGQAGNHGQQQGQGWSGDHSICDDAELHRLLCGADISTRPAAADNEMPKVVQQPPDSNDRDKGVQFAVTCSRSRLKAMVCHAFEGAMLETAGLSDEDAVTVTLRLKR